MNFEFVNRICPNCKNPNYMVSLKDFCTEYKYKCINCNRYFNDSDFEEPVQPVLKKNDGNRTADSEKIIDEKERNMNKHTLIDIDEGMATVLKFIGSEDFYKLSEDLNTPIAGFMFGLSYGLLLASATSRKFLYNVDEDPDNTKDGDHEC